MTPVRIQLSRRKGWRMPANTKKVTRPHKWGNPYIAGTESLLLNHSQLTREESVARHAADVAANEPFKAAVIAELKGYNLACFCQLCPTHRDAGKPFDLACAACRPCHADTLGRIANGITCEAV